MAEIHADLLSLIMALEVPDVLAVATIHVVPDQNDYRATFRFLRAPSGVLEEEHAGPEVERLLIGVYRLAGRVPILDQVQALHESGLLGDLDVVWIRPAAGADRDGSCGYIVRTHAGSFSERAEWLRELTGSSADDD